MRTKSEIIEKKSRDQLSLDLSTTPFKDHHRQRIFLFAAIFLTIGLSLFFIIYRQVKSFLIHPQIKLPSLPSLSLNPPPAASNLNEALTGTVDHLLTTSTNWNVIVSDGDYLYNWSQNFAPATSQSVLAQVGQLSAAPPATILNQYLPQGLSIREQFSTSESLQTIVALISLPSRTLYFNFQFQGPPDQFQTQLSSLAPAIYWTVVQNPLNY